MKKIMIFTSIGGGGHISASRALKSYLDDEYEVQESLFMQTALDDLDIVRMITRGRNRGEDIYNFFMRKKWFFMANLLYRSGRCAAICAKRLIKPRIKHYLQDHKTDIFISVVPVFNQIFLEVAQELDIPFFLVPTDLDATTFIAGIGNSTYKKFFITQAFDDQDIKHSIEKSGITETHQQVVGFPIRADFFEHKDTDHIKQTYDVAHNKPVVMVLMGAVGSHESYHYVQQLMHVTNPFHMIMCVGKNEKLKADLESIELPEHITMTVVGFTDRISDIMAITDLFITKSGTVSVCEGVYMNLPTLLDHTTRSMLWEHFNLTFITQHGFGDVINTYDDIKPLVEKYLSNPELLSSTKKRLSSYDKKHFGTYFKEVLHQHAVNQEDYTKIYERTVELLRRP